MEPNHNTNHARFLERSSDWSDCLISEPISDCHSDLIQIINRYNIETMFKALPSHSQSKVEVSGRQSFKHYSEVSTQLKSISTKLLDGIVEFGDVFEIQKGN